MQKVHQLHKALPGFIHTCHIGKCDTGLFLHVYLGIGFSDTHDAASAACLTCQKSENKEEHQKRYYDICDHKEYVGSIVPCTLYLDPGLAESVHKLRILIHTDRVVSRKL